MSAFCVQMWPPHSKYLVDETGEIIEIIYGERGGRGRECCIDAPEVPPVLLKSVVACCRCSEAVSRIEQSALGTVFICTYGGPKHSASGCHRTYLSQRDLQAHIDYRHLRTHHAPDPRAPSTRDYPLPPKSSPLSQRAPFVSEPPPGVAYHQRGMADSMQHPMQQMHPQPTIMAMAGMSAPQAMTAPPQAMSAPPQAMTAPPAHQAMSAPPAHQVPPPIQTVAAIESYHTIPVMSSSRTNLITVPVQDENNYQRIGGSPQQGAPPGHYPPPTSTTLEYIKSHPPPMSVQPPHMSVQPSIMTQPPPITSSVGPHVGPPPQGVLPPHFSSPQRPYMDELQQPQNLAFGQQGALPNAHHPWPGMSVPGPTLVQGGMALPVQANSRSAQCVAPPSGIVHNRPPNPATMMPAGMLATRPPPAGLPHQSGMPLPTGMLPPQGGMPPVGMMCGPPPQHPPTSSGLGPPSQTRYYQ